jgi:methylation protein EvaC
MKCKITKLPIEPFLSFGKMPIANGFLNKNEFNQEFFF